jgi:hypothetical protein
VSDALRVPKVWKGLELREERRESTFPSRCRQKEEQTSTIPSHFLFGSELDDVISKFKMGWQAWRGTEEEIRDNGWIRVKARLFNSPRGVLPRSKRHHEKEKSTLLGISRTLSTLQDSDFSVRLGPHFFSIADSGVRIVSLDTCFPP